jgi:LuxR family transcriptional regulator, maltose regulon positive regulatory protein
VIELRTSDLQFSIEEAAIFLNKVMGLNLSDPQIRALEITTEGWIAALQMTAISRRGREDIVGFIGSFSGSHRFIAEFF